jgi:hypothetical protein
MHRSKLHATQKGDTVSITLDVRDYEQLVDDLDELDAIRAYDAAKASGETPIPFEKAMQDIDRSSK